MSDMFEKEKLREGLIKAALQAETLRVRVQELEADKAALLQLMRDKADEIVFAATHPETFGVSTFEEIAFALANPEKPD